MKEDAVSYLQHAAQFDLIFIDPPYDSDYYEKVLEEIKLFDILTDGGIIIVETRKNKILPAMDYPLRLIKEYEYGSVKISKFSKEART